MHTKNENSNIRFTGKTTQLMSQIGVTLPSVYTHMNGLYCPTKNIKKRICTEFICLIICYKNEKIEKMLHYVLVHVWCLI